MSTLNASIPLSYLNIAKPQGRGLWLSGAAPCFHSEGLTFDPKQLKVGLEKILA